MKPAPFHYFAPHTTTEALRLLGEHGYDAKLLAGGQSLVPTMNFRLAQPAVLIDLNRIDALAHIGVDDTGALRIGAMTRQAAVEESEMVRQQAPLLHEAIPHIAHKQIRNRGTIGGSIAHADPAAELPAVALALDARLHISGSTGDRWVAVDDFYIGLFTTDLEIDELVTEIEIPQAPPRAGWAIEELARRHGDYALVGVAAQVSLAEDGRCETVRLVYFSVGERPLLAHGAQEALVGQQPSEDAIAAAMAATMQEITPGADIHASREYRRHLVGLLGERTLRTAFTRAAQADGTQRSVNQY